MLAAFALPRFWGRGPGKRGNRADQHMPGQGLGLASVQELVKLYGGTLEIGRSTLGGAQVSLTLKA